MFKRRDLLRAGAAIPAAAAAEPLARIDAKKNKKKKKHKGGGRDYSGMNVLLFITDQQRAIMHFPDGWAEQNLPGATRLKNTGLTFNRAFCASCMCSPSRATLFSGYFPAQHGVKYTLEEDMSPPANPQVELPLDLPNLATVMKAAGYSVPFKGKWHLSKKTEAAWVPNDVNQYGFERWDPPDAGANQDIDQFGGGDPDNDGRFVNDDGDVDLGHEGVIKYLTSTAAQQQPFFLTVSLVNPHDVLSYPQTYDYVGPPPPSAGYDNSDLAGTVGLPPTIVEDLSTKPTAQSQILALLNAGLGDLTTAQMQRNYLNFYGNLMKESDAYLVQILDTLEAQGLLENTLIIQTSDHGEMGLCHNGMRQKMFNFYEETLSVGLVYSNPQLFPQAESTDAMVSHVDFVPTMANLFNVPKSARVDWQGRDYSGVLRKPKKNKKGPQKYVVFTYDDIQAGQANPPYVQAPNHLTTIREGRYKLAKYYDEAGVEPDQWEMYDLKKDQYETVNIADPSHKKNKRQREEYKRLTKKLNKVEKQRLQPL